MGPGRESRNNRNADPENDICDRIFTNYMTIDDTKGAYDGKFCHRGTSGRAIQTALHVSTVLGYGNACLLLPRRAPVNVLSCEMFPFSFATKLSMNHRSNHKTAS